MFPKPLVAFFAFALGAISVAAQVTPGIYRILNVGTKAVALPSALGGPVFVSRAVPAVFPPREIWNITSADQGGFHIQTPTFTVPAAVYAGTEQLQEAEVVRLLESPTTFSITSAGRNQVNIGAINEDFLWTVAPKSTLPANVTLNPANGDAGQLGTALGARSFFPDLKSGICSVSFFLCPSPAAFYFYRK